MLINYSAAARIAIKQYGMRPPEHLLRSLIVNGKCERAAVHCALSQYASLLGESSKTKTFKKNKKTEEEEETSETMPDDDDDTDNEDEEEEELEAEPPPPPKKAGKRKSSSRAHVLPSMPPSSNVVSLAARKAQVRESLVALRAKGLESVVREVQRLIVGSTEDDVRRVARDLAEKEAAEGRLGTSSNQSTIPQGILHYDLVQEWGR